MTEKDLRQNEELSEYELKAVAGGEYVCHLYMGHDVDCEDFALKTWG